MQKRLFIKVLGRVQGVGFRFETHLQFVDLGLTGKAENASDGSVEIEAQGEEENLSRFLDWAKSGPQGAKVENIQTEERPLVADEKK